MRRWGLILAASLVQMISSSIYAMGAYQSELRDGLGLSTESVSVIGSATFYGAFLAIFGGRAFDRLGPRVTCALGGALNILGYSLIGIALYFSESLSAAVKVAVSAVGCTLAGYSSISLLDNVVCMTCSLSFPNDRAAVVGYLKSVLAASAGLWALLWVHLFAQGPGLIAFIVCIASAAGGGTLLALIGLRVLPEVRLRGIRPLE